MRTSLLWHAGSGLAIASAFALAAALGDGGPAPLSGGPAGAALAQGHDDGGQGGPRRGQGGGGHEDGSHDDGGHDEGGHEGGGRHGGSGGSGHGGSGQGAGQGSGKGSGGGNAGGRPPWAQEGIPEVELGRLNVARSPDRVLDRALAEALASFTPEMAAFYSQPLDEVIVRLSTEFESLSYIDSPLQNLALFKGVLEGSTSLPGVSSPPGTLAAIFLGTASDKTIAISTDTVRAVTTILGVPLSEGAVATLAAQAEAVRIAILAGHG